MPSGRVHNSINMAVYAVLAAGAIWASREGLVTLTQTQTLHFSLGFLAGTFLLSPDLDLSEQGVNSKRNWGFLGPLWVPYGMVFSHRGLSHTWLIGPLTRLAYLAILVFLVVGVLCTFWPGVQLPALPDPIEWKVLVPVTSGYFLSQWLHLIADGIRPDHGLRRVRRRRRS
ncbi:MAG: metal-binding protein [Deinococcus sp.]|nr:metal-binding protein [Deinococcus sp.]